jgi:peptide/nickel transport system ATP-binding protein
VSAAALIAVEGLSLAFGAARVLDAVSLSVRPGETLGLVGESGSGKSVAALAMMGLLDRGAKITGGRILFEGEDLLQAGEARLSDLRGRRLAMVFQHPRRALNPTRPVGRQITDVLAAHASLSAKAAKARALEALRRVGVPDPDRRFGAYPFELSGGLCQRVTIALALAASPKLLIADEPTTGLDVTTQAIVLDLIAALAREQGLAVLLITHDLALASERCDRIAVLHAGQVVETAPAAELVGDPRHPYTQALIASTPRPGLAVADLPEAPGTTIDPGRPDLPACRFALRCGNALARCASERPRLSEVGPRHRVACWVAAP